MQKMTALFTFKISKRSAPSTSKFVGSHRRLQNMNMKKLVFIGVLCVHFLGVSAQEIKGNTFIVTDNSFDKKVSIKISTDQSALITINGVEQKLPIEISNGKVLLKNKADNARVINELNIAAQTIDEGLKSYGNINSLEKLLTNANEVPLRTLYIKSEAQLQNGSQQPTDNLLDEGAVLDPVSTTNNWYWYLLLPLAGILVGFILGKLSKGKTTGNKIEVEEEVVQPDQKATPDVAIYAESKAKVKTNVTINQLKLKYDKLREENKTLKINNKELGQNIKSLNDTVQADISCYKIAFQDIVLPLQKAIDAGDLAEIFKLFAISSVVFSAITRQKLSKRQNYDITNINTLLKNKSDHHNYPELTQSTAVDKTPVNLRSTLSILKQLGISGLDNYIIQGYKLRDL